MIRRLLTSCWFLGSAAMNQTHVFLSPTVWTWGASVSPARLRAKTSIHCHVTCTVSLFCNSATQYVKLNIHPSTYPTQTNLIVASLLFWSVTVLYHISQFSLFWNPSLHSVCPAESLVFFFFLERNQLDYTKADKPSSISYPNSAARLRSFHFPLFCLYFILPFSKFRHESENISRKSAQ